MHWSLINRIKSTFYTFSFFNSRSLLVETLHPIGIRYYTLICGVVDRVDSVDDKSVTLRRRLLRPANLFDWTFHAISNADLFRAPFAHPVSQVDGGCLPVAPRATACAGIAWLSHKRRLRTGIVRWWWWWSRNERSGGGRLWWRQA